MKKGCAVAASKAYSVKYAAHQNNQEPVYVCAPCVKLYQTRTWFWEGPPLAGGLHSRWRRDPCSSCPRKHLCFLQLACTQTQSCQAQDVLDAGKSCCRICAFVSFANFPPWCFTIIMRLTCCFLMQNFTLLPDVCWLAESFVARSSTWLRYGDFLHNSAFTRT